MTGKYSCLRTLTIFDLFQRTYISLVSNDRSTQRCTILNRDLGILGSFEIPYESCDILHHVFNNDEGILFGGFDGILHFVALRNLQPQLQATAFEGLTNDINAMTTRGNLIAAGSLAGDVGLWDYTGAKLAIVRHDSQVHSLSIRDEKFLVVTRTDIYEYGIDLEKAKATVSLKPRIKQLDELGVTTWGSYSSDGESILCQKSSVEEQQPLQTYRPALPLSLVDYDNVIHILSRRDTLGEEAAIVIEKLHLGKKIREVSVNPQREISSLWSDRDRLYWTSSGNIKMVDFSFGLSLEAGGKGISLAECFSMGLPDGD